MPLTSLERERALPERTEKTNDRINMPPIHVTTAAT
jgi:hypothetical protein